MKTSHKTTKAIIEQISNTATSWVGHRNSDNKDIISGQTFIAPSELDLEAIEVLTSLITRPGKAVMTVHNFDTQLKSWGPALATATVELTDKDNGKWKAFNIPGLHLSKGQAYGFRLESPNTYFGVGETVGSYEDPLPLIGHEWRFAKNEHNGQAFSYFSLAFKVDVRT